MVVIRKIRRKKKQTTKKLTSLPRIKAGCFGNRTFEPLNASLLALTQWYPIIAVPFTEKFVISPCFLEDLLRFNTFVLLLR